MSEATRSTDEPVYQQTQRVAAEIERSVAGVTVDVSREMIQVDFGDTKHLHKDVPQIARSEGYALYTIFGSTAEFYPTDHPRIE